MTLRDTSRRRYHQFSTGLEEGNRESSGDFPKLKTPKRHLFGQYFRWLRPNTRRLVWLIVLSVLAAGLDAVHPLMTRFIVDGILLDDDLAASLRGRYLHMAGLALLVLIVGGQLVAAARNYQVRVLNTTVTLAIRRALYHRILRLPLETVNQMKTGGVISRITDDVNTSTGLFQLAILSPAVSLLRLLFTFCIVVYINWKLAMCAVGIIPIVSIISFVAVRRIRPVYRSIRRDRAEIDARVGETITGLRAVRAFLGERREERQFALGHHTVTRKELLAYRRELLVWGIWTLLISSTSLIIIWFGGYLYLNNAATLGDIMAFQLYALMLLNPVWHIVESLSELQRSLAAAERVFETLDMPNDKLDPAEPQELPATVTELRIEDVSFAYRNRDPVLHGIDLSVRENEVVAIVGRSGAGKTTVTDLVARFHDPTTGRILLNSVDIRSFRLKAYRGLLAIVQQDVLLFDTSIEENIAYGKPRATFEEVANAAQRAHATEFIDKLPQGFSTVVGERGVKLSGGQKQRIAIARALLADPQILILDEATSNLDTESEQLIQASLEALIRGRTTLVVAHRMSTVTRADRIVVLDDGRIVEEGTHADLMRNKSHYFRMITRQRNAMADTADFDEVSDG